MTSLWPQAFVRSLVEQSVLVPVFVTLFLMGLLSFFGRLKGSLGRNTLFMAWYVGFLAAYGVIYRNVSFPPATVLSWLPWLAIGCATATSFADRKDRAIWGHMARAAGALVSSSLLLAPLLRHEPLALATGQLLAVTGLWFCVWVIVSMRGHSSQMTGSALVIWAMGITAVAPLAGSILLAQLGAGLASALAVAVSSVFVVSLWRASPLGRDAAVVLLGALMVDLRFYAGAPLTVMIVLLLAPVAILVTALLVRNFKGASLGKAVIPPLAGLVPLAAAVWMAFQTYQASGGGY